MILRVINIENKTITEYEVIDGVKKKTTKGDFKKLSTDRLIEAYDYIIGKERALHKHIKAVDKYSKELGEKIVNIKTQKDIESAEKMYFSRYNGIVYGYHALKTILEDFRRRFNYWGSDIDLKLKCYNGLIEHIDFMYEGIQEIKASTMI